MKFGIAPSTYETKVVRQGVEDGFVGCQYHDERYDGLVVGKKQSQWRAPNYILMHLTWQCIILHRLSDLRSQMGIMLVKFCGQILEEHCG